MGLGCGTIDLRNLHQNNNAREHRINQRDVLFSNLAPNLVTEVEPREAKFRQIVRVHR